MNPSALELRSLSKKFGDKAAVRDLSLHIPAGCFYALLGHNGAGKTTTLRMVAGLTQPSSGDALIFGHSVAAEPIQAKQRLAYLPDEPMIYGKLRPLEYLEFVAGLWGLESATARSRAQELLEWTDLWSHRGELAESFSRGMQQKLALCGALIHDPQLLLLDEPLTGLDAMAARQVKDLLQERVKAGGTVVLTTHILDVAERLAERIAIMRAGEVVAEGSLEELRRITGFAAASLEDIFIHLANRAAA